MTKIRVYFEFWRNDTTDYIGGQVTLEFEEIPAYEQIREAALHTLQTRFPGYHFRLLTAEEFDAMYGIEVCEDVEVCDDAE